MRIWWRRVGARPIAALFAALTLNFVGGFPVVAGAQTNSATLSGIVMDSQGAVVPDVAIMVQGDRLSNFLPGRGLVPVGTVGLDRLYEPDYNNFAPRFGFAYDLTGRGRTILRGAYGLYYDTPSQDYFLLQGFQNGGPGSPALGGVGAVGVPNSVLAGLIAAYPTVAQVGQRAIGIGQSVALGVHLDRHRGGKRQKIARILPREVRDRPDHALFPEEPIGKRRHVAHVDAGTDHDASRHDVRQRFGNQPADGREDDGGVERFGRRLVGSAGPSDAKIPREHLLLVGSKQVV